MRPSGLFAVAASLSTASAVLQGFNYGPTQTDGSAKSQTDFQSEFTTAKNLVGTSGDFTSARLYTMIQGGTTNSPTSAIPAAIAEGTSLLLGIWGSGGQDFVNNELAALQAAISQYGSAFTSLVVGLSVGSEDLYRISPIGIAAKSGYGADPDTLVSYIGQVRSAISGTGLSNVPVGHVDTWTAWVNGSNNAVIEAVDFIGTDAYPYFQNTMSNGIESGNSLFQQAYQNTVGAAQGKPVWITETGWPVSGATSGLAVPSLTNAQTYWDEVGCGFAFGKINTFWFTLQDAFPTTPNPSFGVVGTTLSNTPLYDLSCAAVSSSSSSTIASSTTSSSTPASTPTTSATTSATSSETSSSAAVVASSSASSTISSTSTLESSGLSPSQGAGNGIGSSALSVASKTTTSASASTTATVASSVKSASTGIVTSVVSSSTASVTTTTGASSTSAPATFTGAAAAATGSVVGGAIGVFLAVVAAL